MRELVSSQYSAFQWIAVWMLLCFDPLPANALQQAVFGEEGVAEIHAAVNLSDLARREAGQPPPTSRRRVVPFMPMPPRPDVPPVAAPPAAGEGSSGPPTAPSLTPSPAPAIGFQALGDDDTVIPPDTQGAAGPNHLMVTLNSQVRVQNKSGGILSTVLLDSFWSSTGATVVFDPKLTYDPFNNRWIFAAVSNPQSANSSVLIGASQTSDPTGNWNLYRVDVDAQNRNWADYPSLGFNKDWIVVTVNMFSIVAGQYKNSSLYTFRKANIYAGNAATFKLFTDRNGFTQAPAVTYENTLGTLYLVEFWNGNSGGSGYLRLSTISGAIGSEVYTAGTAFPNTPNPWAFGPPGYADFAPQKDSTRKIQLNDSRIINVVYRNGSLWAAQTAFLPANSPTRAAAQWWQLAPSGTVQQFGRVDDAAGTFFYAFPSIAVNTRNDVLLGFSSFASTQYASAGYAFRAASDPSEHDAFGCFIESRRSQLLQNVQRDGKSLGRL
ncbi:MAG: hypothetical protein HY313_04955 [Acidobacteria bacterium]|nr:hypothetical protein [Acidobacteriota bacterium]